MRRFFSLCLVLACLAATNVNRVTANDGDWHQWRGPNRDGISTETGLLSSWPKEGPRIVYQSKGLGSGMASVAIANGLVYTIGNVAKNAQLVCLQQNNGDLVWKTPFATAKGPANGTPTVDLETGFVYAISFDGSMICCDGKTGKEIWTRNFPKDFKGKIESSWGFSESPLIDADRVLCTPGGVNAMVVALNKRTGETVWSGNAPSGKLRGNDGAGYSSIIISNAAGKKQYVQLIGHGIVSYDAANGDLLWNYDRVANKTANIPTPIAKDNFVFCSTGYGDGGTALLEISRQGNKFNAKEVYYKSAKELQNHHGGMIMIGDCVFMGHGHNNGFPACVQWRTGKDLWEKGRGPGSGSAAIVCADKKLFFRYQDGTMAVIDTNTSKYELLGQFKLATLHAESWPHPVIANGKMFIRDQNELVVYDLKE
ncbi:MAG: PQQ-binding-like beta-propeller repeat protein [Pirellula sp.]